MNIPILCFEHCGPKIFCSGIPEFCPACGKHLSSFDSQSLPFRLPYPFVKADQHPCAVVMKPTAGTFLDDYNCEDDLHIAVTDSKGSICEFDSDGLQMGRTEGWHQVILIYKISEVWMDHWDSVLLEIQKDPLYTPERYNEDSFNCYSFVLEFLKRLKCDELNKYLENKKIFCEKFVLGRTKTSVFYINVYRKVKNNGYFFETV